MKWSFTGLFESSSPAGHILHVGSKTDSAKKRSLPRQSMHNLQREYYGLDRVAVVVSVRAFTQNTAAEVGINGTDLASSRGIFSFFL